MSIQLLVLSDVEKKTSLSSSSIYKFIKEKGFPHPTKFGTRSLWNEEAIDTWIENTIAEQEHARCAEANV